MKNSSIKLAVLMMAALAVSCQVSETFEDSYIPEKGDFLIRLGNNTKATKALDVAPMSVNGTVIDLGTQDGTNFYLEETITRLDGQANGPETKGTPAYTENVGVLYSTLGLYAAGNFGNVSFDCLDNEMFNGGWRYKHTYATDPWPNESDQVGFYLRMPETMNGVTTTMTAATPYGKDASGNTVAGAITFDYTSPTTVANMQDIGFAYRTMSKDDYKGYGKNGAPFLFNHALTGVKFAIGNTDEDIKENEISITEVIFKGLYDTGTCTIKPVSENGYTDNITNYSSSANGVVVWTGKEATTFSTETGYSSGTFGNPINFVEKGTEIDDGNTNTYDSFGANGGNYPKSFAEAGATKNLNDQAASQTFWFIPQSLNRRAPSGEEGTNNYVAGETPVTLTVKYTYRDIYNAEHPGVWVIDFGKLLSNIEWKAGELRTYTLRIADVNVKIEDDVVMSDAYTDYTGDEDEKFLAAVGSYKENVTITNTGNNPAFIRAAIVGQWVDKDGRPVFGFTDYKTNSTEPIPSWYDDQFGHSATYTFGYFSKLVDYDASGTHTDAGKYTGKHWHRGSDGYYYYDEAVPAGEEVGELLFESYTIASVPNVTVAGVDTRVTFVLEVATQAINANKTDGTAWNSYTDAWNDASNR